MAPACFLGLCCCDPFITNAVTVLHLCGWGGTSVPVIIAVVAITVEAVNWSFFNYVNFCTSLCGEWNVSYMTFPDGISGFRSSVVVVMLVSHQGLRLLSKKQADLYVWVTSGGCNFCSLASVVLCPGREHIWQSQARHFTLSSGQPELFEVLGNDIWFDHMSSWCNQLALLAKHLPLLPQKPMWLSHSLSVFWWMREKSDRNPVLSMINLKVGFVMKVARSGVLRLCVWPCAWLSL